MPTRLIITAAALLAFAPIALAEDNPVTSAGTPPMHRPMLSASTTAARMQTRLNQTLTRAHDRANEEIGRRLASLENSIGRIQNAARVPAADKTSLLSALQSQIDSLTALKGQIDSDTSTSSLKEAIQSITASYRIYALVIPQASITAAADRTNTVIAQMQALSGKLASRIASTTGDTAALTTALTDLNAKVADASAQVQAAVAEVSGLKPDNGDQTIAASNKAALKDASAKMKTAQNDLQAARQDAEKIVQAVRGKKVSATATTTTP